MSMNLDARTSERVTEWVSGGNFAVAVEVQAITIPDRPGEFFLTPETTRYLETLRRDAEAGNMEPLKKAGKVYQLLTALD